MSGGPSPHSAEALSMPKIYTLNETSTPGSAHTSRIRSNELLGTPKYEDEAITNTTKIRRPTKTSDSESSKDTNENITPVIEILTNKTALTQTRYPNEANHRKNQQDKEPRRKRSSTSSTSNERTRSLRTQETKDETPNEDQG